jgi:regulatory protein
LAFGAPSVKGKALRYLARREHSRAELERKLAAKVEDKPEESANEQIARALDELAAHGLQSEERVAESLLNTVGQRFGNRRLRQVLQAKELPAELVANTLEQAAATELQRAREVWKRKYGEPAKDAAERVRQARFLASRGFSSDVITRVVRGLEED